MEKTTVKTIGKTKDAEDRGTEYDLQEAKLLAGEKSQRAKRPNTETASLAL